MAFGQGLPPLHVPVQKHRPLMLAVELCHPCPSHRRFCDKLSSSFFSNCQGLWFARAS